MTLHPSAHRVQEALDSVGIKIEVVELPQSTRTAQDAAGAVGCEVGQIVKSLVFQGVESSAPLLVLTSGANRADLQRIEIIMGEAYCMAEAAFVREKTGFAIGGVAPLAHPIHIETLIDEDLMAYDQLWAAAGTPHAVFKCSPDQLIRISNGHVAEIA